MMIAKLSYILLLVSFWIGSSATFVYSAELIDRIAAIVNGEIITQRQLNQGKVIIKENFGVQTCAPKARVLPLDDTPTEEIDDFRLKIDYLQQILNLSIFNRQ